MPTLEQKKPGFSTGVYTVSDAAFLLRTDARKVARWARDYSVYFNKNCKSDSGVPLLTFQDIVELKYVAFFRENGVPLKRIRKSSEALTLKYDIAYPFAAKRCVTDGADIIIQESGLYMSADARQIFFDFVELFIKQLDFEDDDAIRWYPEGREKLVVVDPEICFGAPVVTGHRIPTKMVYDTYKTCGNDIPMTRKWYGITRREVEDAIEFEQQWQKKAA